MVKRRPRRGIKRLLWNFRHGRMQRTLALATAASAPPLAFEIWTEHFKGSFGDKWMWTPIVLTPPLTLAGVAAYGSSRVAKTALPLVSALYALDGVIGIVTHVRGVGRKPGGFGEPTYNIVMGPPLLAPGSLLMVGAMGLLAPVMRREI
ncbi:MAG TPA: hypothetical protein VFT42_06030 [Solirubrobacteraceae bacterium]|nr:hypothetical protein [Solirubrobacteraceae bacterium]